MRAKRSLGQNFLNDPKTLKTIVDQGNIKPDDIILEIGPGTGNLTKCILNKKPKEFTVIEKDNYLIEKLKDQFEEKINIINNDVLNVNENSLFSEKAISLAKN